MLEEKESLIYFQMEKRMLIAFALQISSLLNLLFIGTPVVDGKSVHVASQPLIQQNCGDPQLKGTWLVEIHPKHRFVPEFCYGALISDRQVLTSQECLWTFTRSFGPNPVAKFPNVDKSISIEFRPIHHESSTRQGQGLAIFQLKEGLSTRTEAAFAPICLLPIDTTTRQSCEVPSPFLCQENDDDDKKDEGDMCNEEGIRRAGFPKVVSSSSSDGSEKFFLDGIRANTCDKTNRVSFLNVTAFRRWIHATTATTQVDLMDQVNGLCPKVMRSGQEPGICTNLPLTVEDDLVCDTETVLPGFINSTSKVACQDWKVLSFNESSVRILCNDENDGDGEVLEVAKSRISCRVIDCVHSQDDSQRILLSELEDCLTLEEIGDIGTGPPPTTQNSFSSQDDAITTMASMIDNEEEMDLVALRSGSTTTQGNVENNEKVDERHGDCGGEPSTPQSCGFPFLYEGTHYFQCIRRFETSPPECLTRLGEWLECSENCPLMKYHTHEALISSLQEVENLAGKNLAETFTLGKSINGSELMGIRLRRNGSTSEDELLKPLVKLVGNMHGNEPTGREVLIHLARYLVLVDKSLNESQRAQDEMATLAKLVLDKTDLWLLPTMNPDGFSRGTEGKCFGGNYNAGRTNERGVDLNRDFPSWRESGNNQTELKQGRQQETRLVMDWILGYPFVLSANFHDGAVLANYPYDDYRSQLARNKGGVSPTPDHDIFVHLAKTYTSNHPYMEDTSKRCPYWGYFKDGITNGAEWYEVSGGMQDFNYDFSNAMELTIEVSCCKYPSRSRLGIEWENNAKSILKYVKEAQNGVRGFVRDGNNQAISGAHIQVRKIDDVQWRAKNVTSDGLGRYWRILLNGTYVIRAVKDDFVSSERTIELGSDEYKRIDFTISNGALLFPSK